jgi:hypothetical protein
MTSVVVLEGLKEVEYSIALKSIQLEQSVEPEVS